jgi:UDP-GlcNAc:undecaprenyl-phosphate/decaprenyl-phosphate GlcNAc-1-phosphate transferase
MITPKLIILPLLAATVTLLLLPMVRRLSQKVGSLAIPNNRRLHAIPIPQSGGVAIFFGFLVAALFFNRTSPEIIGFLLGGTVITGVGLLDDIFDLPPITKFFGQILAALIVIYSGVRIEFVANPTGGGLLNLGFLSLPFTFLWIVGVANAINFLDGLDGLAAGVAGISAWTLGVVALVSGRYDAAVLAFTLGAAAFAFLPTNFSENCNRKMFMGDAGSNFLGYSLAVVSIMGMVKVAAAFSMLLPMLVLAIPLFDTGFAIFRRLIAGKSPFEPDSAHLHHRIMHKGFTHKQTAFIIYGVNIILGVIAILSTRMSGSQSVLVFAFTALILFFVAWRLGLITLKKTIIT